MNNHFLFLKTYYQTIKTDHSKSNLNLIMEMINELDRNCDVKLKKKFKSHPYGKALYKQKFKNSHAKTT